MMTSPLGVNNLNQLVEQQLGNTGYEVVRTIYNNIQWLYSVYEALPKVGSVQQISPYLDIIIKNTHSLEAIANNLYMLSNLESNLPLVQDLAPRIESFKNSLNKYQEELALNNKKVSELDELYVNSKLMLSNLEMDTKNLLKHLIQEAKAEVSSQIEDSLCVIKKFREVANNQYDELMANNNKLTKYLSLAQDNNKMLKHLMASDAVNTYLWEQTPAYKEQALNAIKASEKVGNSETTNRHKMKANKTDLNLFKVLNRNNLKLANANIANAVGSVEGECND